MSLKPIDTIRTKEEIWRIEYAQQTLSDEGVIQALVKHPELLERPIYIQQDVGIIARDLDKLRSFLKSLNFSKVTPNSK